MEKNIGKHIFWLFQEGVRSGIRSFFKPCVQLFKYFHR